MEWLENADPNIAAAVISAVVAIVVLILGWILRDFYERRFHIFRLEYEHRYAQRKQIKEILARNKVQLLTACDSLSHRINHLCGNFDSDWLDFDRLADIRPKRYYLTSFVYRLVSVFSWIRIIEMQMVYLDTTIAGRNDMDFGKYLRLLPQVLSDASLFEGFEYNPFLATDHFFLNSLENMSDSLIQGDKVETFSVFQQNLNPHKKNLEAVFRFLNGIDPYEDRLRWDRLQLLHAVLLCFLSSYGYDFQRSDTDDFRRALTFPRPNRVPANSLRIIGRYRIEGRKELKRLVRELRRLAV